jgi:hypothetical protein
MKIDWVYNGLLTLNISLVGTTPLIGKAIGNNIIHKAFYDCVEYVADRDNDGATTKDEWKDVYRKIGKHFNELEPRKLTTEDLRKYLDL